MHVPEEIRKTVVFLGIRKHDRFVPKATGFMVLYHEYGHAFYYLVTAEHVVSGLLTKGHKIFMRANSPDGAGIDIEIPAGVWAYHPEGEKTPTDVAIAPCMACSRFDLMTLAINGEKPCVATKENLRDLDGNEIKIDAGDDIFIVGLFRNHAGVDKNITLVRAGHIAAMKADPVKTEFCGYIEAHLIEAMSIGGLSGSPVFISLPPIRFVKRNPSILRTKTWYLFGLMHGHFDVQNLNEDVVNDNKALGSINTGIGVVVPIEKIVETIEQQDVAAERKQHARSLNASGGATADLPPTPPIQTT